jgi:hypothetical protein
MNDEFLIDYFKRFLFYIKNILIFVFKLKYLNKFFFLSYIKKTQFSPYKKKYIYIYIGFQLYIRKIRFFLVLYSEL